ARRARVPMRSILFSCVLLNAGGMLMKRGEKSLRDYRGETAGQAGASPARPIGVLTYSFRRKIFVDLILEEAPGRRRTHEAAVHFRRYASVLDDAATGEFDFEDLLARVVADRAERGSADALSFHGISAGGPSGWILGLAAHRERPRAGYDNRTRRHRGGGRTALGGFAFRRRLAPRRAFSAFRRFLLPDPPL